MLLENLLVICTCYEAPGLQTVQCLLDLRGAGADVKMLRGTADVSITRCIAAGVAEHLLTKQDSGYTHVLFLDSDVWSSAAAVEKLIELQLSLSLQLNTRVSVSGLYLNRHKRDQSAAAHKLRNTEVIACGDSDGNTQQVAIHALCGLGAFLTPTNSLIEHCETSDRMFWPDREHKIPIVCMSSPIESSRLSQYVEGINPGEHNLYWQGEDFDYCCREIDDGRPVLVAPVLFYHTTTTELMPVGTVTFPGYLDPDAT